MYRIWAIYGAIEKNEIFLVKKKFTYLLGISSIQNQNYWKSIAMLYPHSKFELSPVELDTGRLPPPISTKYPIYPFDGIKVDTLATFYHYFNY